MKPPTPPREIQEQIQAEDTLELERSETVEVVLFEYEDDNVSFCISFEFVYTFTHTFDRDDIVN